ncbi:hypothetical protein [Amorphus sp. 3PC139-8]|uniref:hypothetical protein n=1 Tax=Amorphus sp. 3PC139-8 TaxID=2735676 RepID=UPI00345CB6C3
MATSPQSASSDRWEFRVWLPPDVVDNPLAGWQETGEDNRTDRYLLLPERPDLLTKLRGGERFEIKRRVDRKPPFERWSVAVSAAFPLGPEICAAVGSLLMPQHTALSDTDGQTVTNLLTALTTAQAAFETRSVTKVRHRFQAGDVMGEWTSVTVEETGIRATTLAFETADLDALTAAVDGLRISNVPNRNYGAWLLGT